MAREWTVRMQQSVTESNKGCNQGSWNSYSKPEGKQHLRNDGGYVLMKIRKWRLAGELRRELNRPQTQELLRALAQSSPDLSFLSPSQRNAVRVLVAYNAPDVLAQYFQRAPTDRKSSAKSSESTIRGQAQQLTERASMERTA